MTIQYIYPQRRTDRRLGRVAAHDPRSRMFARRASGKPLQTVLHRHEAPVLDQENLGACTGFTDADVLNLAMYAPARRRVRGNTRYLTALDGRAFYSTATHIDEFDGQWPPTDTGSSGLAAAKAMQQQGYIQRYEWIFGWLSFQQNLMDTAIMCGTWWTEDMFYPDANGFVRPTGRQAGGHEYACIGANYRFKYLTFLNHWGPNWGLKGRFRMHFDDFAALLADDGDGVVPVL